jgi:hypothetical protein
MVYAMGPSPSSYVLPFIFCGLLLLSAGCLTDTDPPVPETTPTRVIVTPTPDNPVVTVPPADMALRNDDLPSDYRLKDRTVTSYAGVGQVFRDLGWQQGYRASFYRLDTDTGDTTSIVQEIEVYPLDTVKDAYTQRKETLLPVDESRTDYQVPFPLTGDRSIAWREVRSPQNVPVVTYTVIFTKKNVYEKISMTGTSTDYELLKTLAATAVARVC